MARKCLVDNLEPIKWFRLKERVEWNRDSSTWDSLEYRVRGGLGKGPWKHLHGRVGQRVALSLDVAEWEPYSGPYAFKVLIWPPSSYTPPGKMRILGGTRELVHLVPISRSSSEYLNPRIPCSCGSLQVSLLTFLSWLYHMYGLL